MVDWRLCAWVWNRSPDLGLQAAVVPDEPAGRGRSRRDIAVVGEGSAKSSSFYKPDLAGCIEGTGCQWFSGIFGRDNRRWRNFSHGESDLFRSPSRIRGHHRWRPALLLLDLTST
jgi:hypothetical protein